MKVVILAGGLGTRLSEETDIRPKPMVEIGGRPILWHIMKIYSRHGFTEFVICLGYKGYLIKEYFHHYLLRESDVVIDLAANATVFPESKSEPWKITLVETGLKTMTGGRIRRAQKYVGAEPFMLTYGDGVADIDLAGLLRYHRGHGRLGTLTAVQPTGRFGALSIAPDGRITSFQEKPKGDGTWINGGFFVLQPEVFDLLTGDEQVWEQEPLETLARRGELAAFKHGGFWHPMDTIRDKLELESLWGNGRAPWKTWDD